MRNSGGLCEGGWTDACRRTGVLPLGGMPASIGAAGVVVTVDVVREACRHCRQMYEGCGDGSVRPETRIRGGIVVVHVMDVDGRGVVWPLLKTNMEMD